MEKTLLEIVTEITSGDRRRDYGRPLANHLRIAIDWTLFMHKKLGVDKTITPADVVWMMVGLKQAREINTPKLDNSVDTAGYVACLDDMYQQLVDLEWAGDKEMAKDVMADLNLPQMWWLLLEADKADERSKSVGETPAGNS